MAKNRNILNRNDQPARVSSQSQAATAMDKRGSTEAQKQAAQLDRRRK